MRSSEGAPTGDEMVWLYTMGRSGVSLVIRALSTSQAPSALRSRYSPWRPPGPPTLASASGLSSPRETIVPSGPACTVIAVHEGQAESWTLDRGLSMSSLARWFSTSPASPVPMPTGTVRSAMITGVGSPKGGLRVQR